MIYVRTDYDQDRKFEVVQPVQFDHRHHVRDDGIDCLYCHSGAENSPFAGVPATELCMGCHAQIWNDSPLLEPVRQSFYTGKPIRWLRVHKLPDFVYFNHSVHVHAGLQCKRCHGDVEDMPVVFKKYALTMDFCLDCHRHPERAVPDYVNTIASPAPSTGALRQGRAEQEQHVPIVTNNLITCTACHR
ncbi:MAG TPA: cytochrome c3 family protein [Polyangiaceae bacterium]|nr:cytochrome c3 family protein [Polyangiaceae bacterium]